MILLEQCLQTDSPRILIYNLRAPGQYYQAEIGLNYNYFRDYDPVIGRYVESDPLGIRGGINPITYVANRPTEPPMRPSDHAST